MLDRQTAALHLLPPPAAVLPYPAAPAPAPAPHDQGWAQCLMLSLDEVDHGLLLLDSDGTVRLMNRSARAELDQQHPLHLVAGQVHARSRIDKLALARAWIAVLQQGQRELLSLGEGDSRVSVSLVPLAATLGGGAATLMALGKRGVGDGHAVQGFARAHGLTPAETRVLASLCAGVPPAQIAEQQGVRISTVRTQIGGLREKTGADSIGALVRMVAVLPPVAAGL